MDTGYVSAAVSLSKGIATLALENAAQCVKWWEELPAFCPVCLTQELLHCCYVQKTSICHTDRRCDGSTEQLALLTPLIQHFS